MIGAGSLSNQPRVKMDEPQIGGERERERAWEAQGTDWQGHLGPMSLREG